tara:strand:+ start:182 stop:628 length:447 start_codon:yes stop_codon:yes gene_type:complete
MAAITPTFTLTSAAAPTGPLSIALALSTSDSLSVDTVSAEILTCSTSQVLLFDGSVLAGLDGDASPDAGVNGSFVYMKNVTASDLDIYIGCVTSGDMTGEINAATAADRLFTLKQGEFAFFPFDYCMDITVDSEGAGLLEYFLFNRNL